MVQCTDCKKWRLIPSMQHYNIIKETQLQTPFVCGTTSGWTPNMSCNVPQDGTTCDTWPSIPPIPTGWSRSVHIISESTKFADVYYFPPSGERLRSSAEVQSFLDNHPEYVREGVNRSQFSFQIPKPLDDNYVKKRTRPVKRRKSSKDNNCEKGKK
ncbi:Zinc finger CW-type [Arabidopsis suecica]|uniref:Zinc finger CW-type n=1 Tax=Arabidopsis suecica TaxID=45249 RepID=A0A8T2DEW5_ARASU|nr:Zinc finger CW-type [Arabidopsis suecica]